MKRNIFITGVNGFVGSAAAEKLLSQGDHVIGLVKDKNRKSVLGSHKNLSIVNGDLLDLDTIRYCLSKYEVTHVLHLASQPIVRICHSDPYTAYMTNIVGTVNLLEAARNLELPVKKIIVMTSDKAYGPAPVPYTEDTPPAVGDTYSTSKTCQDMIALSYARTYGVPAVVVRASNIYGPGDLNLSRLIPRSILNLLEGGSPMLYNGVAEFVREFIHVSDIVSAFEKLLDVGKTGEAYNVGGTGHYTIKEVIQMVVDKVNPAAKINIVEKDFYEIREQYLDATKLMSLGWAPKYNLSDGLDNTIEWYKNYLAK